MGDVFQLQIPRSMRNIMTSNYPCVKFWKFLMGFCPAYPAIVWNLQNTYVSLLSSELPVLTQSYLHWFSSTDEETLEARQPLFWFNAETEHCPNITSLPKISVLVMIVATATSETMTITASLNNVFFQKSVAISICFIGILIHDIHCGS